MTRLRSAVIASACASLAIALGIACGGATTGARIGTDTSDGGGDATEGGSPGTQSHGGVVADATVTHTDSGSSMEVPDSGTSIDAGPEQPFVVATATSQISSFAIDSTSVYWTSAENGTPGAMGVPVNGTVSKCPLAGCAGSPTLLATHQSYAQNLVVSGSTLYWLDYNAASLMRCSVDCNDDAVPFYTWPEVWLGVFTVNPAAAFFTGPNGSGLVQECPSSGCVTPTTFASGQNPKGFATSDAGLVWTNYLEQQIRNSIIVIDGGVMTCPLSGCDDAGPTTLAWGQIPTSLVVSEGTAYWAQGTSVVACAVTGCNGAPATIASLPSGYARVGGMAVDATGVYFAGVASQGGVSSSIWKCARGGCPGGPTQLALMATTDEIAVDATRVYYLSGDDTQILAVDK